MSYYDAFAHLCKESGVKQFDALKDMGLSHGAAQYWKKGKPSDETIKVMSRYFGVPFERIANYSMTEPKVKHLRKDDGLQELIDLYRVSTPPLRRAAIAVLKSGLVDKIDR